MNYYNQDSIKSVEDLFLIINHEGISNQNLDLNGDLSSLGQVKKVYGNIYINNKLENLGELNYVQGNLISHDENSLLKTLGKLERVDGDVNLRYSNIESLGNLSFVGGKLTLRDTNIIDLGSLKFVGGDLFLPSRFKDIDLTEIEVKGKIRFWNNVGESKNSKLTQNNNWEVTDHFSTIHHREIESKKRCLESEFLVKRCYKPNELNDYITANINDFFEFVDLKLNELYQDKHSFFDVLFNEVKSINEINSEFPQIKIDKRKTGYWEEERKISNQKIVELKKEHPFTKYNNTLKNFKKSYKFQGYTSKYWLSYNEHKLMLCENTGLSETSFIYYVENSILETFSVFIHSLQNEFRVSRGIPRIGEGWVSETDLYYKLKGHFSPKKVIHHGKPKWLGKQHVDIWFPDYKIGIEYQGQQHDRPIEFFGGEKSFEENKKRDERKRILFKENNAFLIEVREGFDFEILCENINSLIIKK
jgi:hypothetical protein